MRNRIRDGRDGHEPEHAILVAAHDTSPVRPRAVRMLHIIPPRRVRLPDIDLHVADRASVRVAHVAHHQEWLAPRVGGDVVPRAQLRGVVRVERAQDRAFGRAARFGVVDGVDEDGEAEDVGEEDEFLAS